MLDAKEHVRYNVNKCSNKFGGPCVFRVRKAGVQVEAGFESALDMDFTE